MRACFFGAQPPSCVHAWGRERFFSFCFFRGSPQFYPLIRPYLRFAHSSFLFLSSAILPPLRPSVRPSSIGLCNSFIRPPCRPGHHLRACSNLSRLPFLPPSILLFVHPSVRPSLPPFPFTTHPLIDLCSRPFVLPSFLPRILRNIPHRFTDSYFLPFLLFYYRLRHFPALKITTFILFFKLFKKIVD